MKKNVLKKMVAFALAFALVAALLPGLAFEAFATEDKNVVTLPTIASKEWTGETLTADVPSSDKYTVVKNDGGIAPGTYPVVLALVDPANDQWSMSSGVEITLTFEITGCAHDWEYTYNGDDTHTKACKKNCGEAATTESCNGAATCTAAAYCDLCKTSRGEALGHELKAVASAEAAGRTVNCQNCDYSCRISLNIVGGDVDDGLFAYTGSPITPAAVAYSTEWVGETPVITYENNVQSMGVGSMQASVSAVFEELGITLKNQFQIWPKALDESMVTVTPASAPYTGAAHTAPTITVTLNGKELVAGTDYSLGAWSGNLTDAAAYTVKITGKGNFLDSVNAVYTVTEAEMPAFTFTQAEALTYNGTAQTPTAYASATSVNGNDVTFIYSDAADGAYANTLPSFTDAGTYTVYYRATADNYQEGSGSFTVTIGKAANKWTTTPSIAGWTYGEEPNAPVAAAKDGTVTVTYTGTTNAGVAYESAEAPTQAGSYKAVFTVEETANYTGLTKEVSFIVDRAWVNPDDFRYTEPTDIVYNGQTQNSKIKIDFDYRTDDMVLALDCQRADTMEPAYPINAGDYKFNVLIKYYTANYNAAYFTRDDFKFTIHKATPTITWEETEFTYDGAEHGEATIALVAGETYSGTITYTYTKGGTTVNGLPTNAGTYTVTASIAEQDNYEAVSATTTIVIKPKTVAPELTVDPDLFTYNGTACRPEVLVKVDGASLALEDNYSISYTNNTNVGVATLTVTSLAGSNYTFETVSVDYLIVPNLSELDGITTENVTSAYLDIIEELQAQMEGVDPNSTSAAAQARWEEIEKYLSDLEAAIREILAKIDQIIDGTVALGDHPTTDRVNEIEDLLDLYDSIENRLTDGEKADLADEIEKLETEKAHIEKTNKDVADALADTDEILAKELTNVDRAELEILIDRIEELLEDPHLSEQQEKDLEDALAKLKAIRDEILAIEQKIVDDTEALGDHPTTDKLDEIEDLLDLYDEDQDQMTTEERETLTDEIEKLETEKAHIEKTNKDVADALADTDEILAKELTNVDRAELEILIDRIEELLEDPHLSEQQEKDLEDALAKLKAIRDEILAIEQKIVDDTEALGDHPTTDKLDEIEDLLDLYDEYQDQMTGGEKSDLADEIEKLKTEKAHIEETNKAVEKALADTAEMLETELTNVDRAELEELIDRIEELLQDPHLSEQQRKDLEDALAALNKIRDDILAIIQQIIDGTADLGDHPTTDKLDEIEDLLDLYDEYQDQMTGGEKSDLADEIEKLKTEKGHIEKTNKDVKDILDDVDKLLEKELTYKDRDKVEDLIDRIEEELQNPHLSEQQRKDLEDALAKLKIIEEEYKAAEKVEDMIDDLPKTGDPDDDDIRGDYQDTKEAYDGLPNKDLVKPKAVAKLEKLAKALRNYKIIKGNGQRWYKNDEEAGNLSFTANGPYDKFAYVKIDGELLDEKYYTSKEGSTIVTLKASYLETLSYAKHTIVIGYEDGDLSGEASGYFRVTLHTDSPATGDTTNIVLLSVLALSSLLGMAAMVTARKKRGA